METSSISHGWQLVPSQHSVAEWARGGNNTTRLAKHIITNIVDALTLDHPYKV